MRSTPYAKLMPQKPERSQPRSRSGPLFHTLKRTSLCVHTKIDHCQDEFLPRQTKVSSPKQRRFVPPRTPHIYSVTARLSTLSQKIVVGWRIGCGHAVGLPVHRGSTDELPSPRQPWGDHMVEGTGSRLWSRPVNKSSRGKPPGSSARTAP